MRRRCLNALAGLALVAMFVVAAASSATAMTCGNKLVTEGMTGFEIVRVCGEPDYKELDAVEWDGFRYRRVERWYYDCGYQRFVRILIMKGGVLKRIDFGPEGSGSRNCN